jgi:hypothetical protein
MHMARPRQKASPDTKKGGKTALFRTGLVADQRL